APLRAVLDKALAADPAERYPDAGELGADLEALAEGRPVRAKPPGARRALARLGRRVLKRRKMLAVSGGLILTAGLIVAGLALYRAHQADLRRTRAEALLRVATRLQQDLERGSGEAEAWQEMRPTLREIAAAVEEPLRGRLE